MALGLTIAPWHCECCTHCVQVTLQAGSEATQFGGIALRQTVEPSIKLPGPSTVHQPKKFATQTADFCDLGFNVGVDLFSVQKVPVGNQALA